MKYQVNVSNKDHAAYLEGQVAHYTWKVILDILFYLWSLNFLLQNSSAEFCSTQMSRKSWLLYVEFLKIFYGIFVFSSTVHSLTGFSSDDCADNIMQFFLFSCVSFFQFLVVGAIFFILLSFCGRLN